MFSISSAQFPYLPEFANKIKSHSHEKPEFDELSSWCAEKGFLLHYSKIVGESSQTQQPTNEVFYTLKYDRAKLTDEQYETVGRLRSIVFDKNGRICCVAPPKMLTLTDELKKAEVNSVNGVLVAEELVEGVMANLFWHADTARWYIATKSCVGEVSFDHILQAEAEAQAQAAPAPAPAPAPETGTNTDDAAGAAADSSKGFQRIGVQELLRRRICEVLSLLTGGLDVIPRQYCYSLVIQHPKNQIVNTITVPRLYLVAVYEISAHETEADAVNVIRVDRDIFSGNFCGSVSHMPSTLTCVLEDTDTSASATFNTHTVEDYTKMYASTETRSGSLPGVVFVDKDTGFCYKQRNPIYEGIKKRKGVEKKLMAQYLQLRKDRAIDEYLKYHPQHSRTFSQFRDRLHDYTQRLYDAYIEHYVKKNAKPLKEYDRELKTHMYKLHYDVYLATMKSSGVFVTKHAVIDYVNQLAPAQQLACLSATLPASTTVDVGAEKNTQRKQPFQRRPIERSNHSEGVGGFRSMRPSRGGRMVPSLTVQIPDADASEPRVVQLKGAKSTGHVKVHNSFAGLDVD